jgi:hypothetical protein
VTTSASHPPVRHHITPLAIGLVVVFAFIALFTSALHNPEPRDVEVAIVGTSVEVGQLQDGLNSLMPDGFTLHAYPDEHSASDALTDQEVDGVYLPHTTPRPQLLIASADGFAVSDVLKAVFGNLGGHGAAIRDLAPLPAYDSKGISGFMAVAGTTIGSLIFSGALFLLTSRTSARRRFTIICAFAPLAGVTAALDVRFVAHGLEGRFWAVAGILALVSAATAMTSAGVIRLVGAPGIALCVIGLAFLCLPASGGPLGYQFLPASYQAFTHGLPSTAGISALRGAIYFDGAGILTPILVLAGWVIGGIGLYGVATLVRQSHPHPPMLGVPDQHLEILKLAEAGSLKPSAR